MRLLWWLPGGVVRHGGVCVPHMPLRACLGDALAAVGLVVHPGAAVRGSCGGTPVVLLVVWLLRGLASDGCIPRWVLVLAGCVVCGM